MGNAIPSDTQKTQVYQQTVLSCVPYFKVSYTQTLPAYRLQVNTLSSSPPLSLFNTSDTTRNTTNISNTNTNIYSGCNLSRIIKTFACYFVPDNPNTKFALKIVYKYENVEFQIYKNLLKQTYGKQKNYEGICILPWRQLIENDKAFYIGRQWIYSTLYERMKMYPPLQTNEISWIVFQILQTIDIIHTSNIVHGDIKLQNIFLTEDNWILISDIAFWKPTMVPNTYRSLLYRFFENNESGISVTTLAPERIRVTHCIETSTNIPTSTILSTSCDIFSLGCILITLYTYYDILDISMLFQYRRNGKLNILQQLLQRIDDIRIRDVIANMLQLDPTQRKSAKEYIDILVEKKYFPSYFYELYYDTVDVLRGNNNSAVNTNNNSSAVNTNNSNSAVNTNNNNSAVNTNNNNSAVNTNNNNSAVNANNNNSAVNTNNSNNTVNVNNNTVNVNNNTVNANNNTVNANNNTVNVNNNTVNTNNNSTVNTNKNNNSAANNNNPLKDAILSHALPDIQEESSLQKSIKNLHTIECKLENLLTNFFSVSLKDDNNKQIQSPSTLYYSIGKLPPIKKCLQDRRILSDDKILLTLQYQIKYKDSLRRDAQQKQTELCNQETFYVDDQCLALCWGIYQFRTQDEKQQNNEIIDSRGNNSTNNNNNISIHSQQYCIVANNIDNIYKASINCIESKYLNLLKRQKQKKSLYIKRIYIDNDIKHHQEQDKLDIQYREQLYIQLYMKEELFTSFITIIKKLFRIPNTKIHIELARCSTHLGILLGKKCTQQIQLPHLLALGNTKNWRLLIAILRTLPSLLQYIHQNDCVEYSIPQLERGYTQCNGLYHELYYQSLLSLHTIQRYGIVLLSQLNIQQQDKQRCYTVYNCTGICYQYHLLNCDDVVIDEKSQVLSMETISTIDISSMQQIFQPVSLYMLPTQKNQTIITLKTLGLLDIQQRCKMEKWNANVYINDIYTCKSVSIEYWRSQRDEQACQRQYVLSEYGIHHVGSTNKADTTTITNTIQIHWIHKKLSILQTSFFINKDELKDSYIVVPYLQIITEKNDIVDISCMNCYTRDTTTSNSSNNNNNNSLPQIWNTIKHSVKNNLQYNDTNGENKNNQEQINISQNIKEDNTMNERWWRPKGQQYTSQSYHAKNITSLSIPSIHDTHFQTSCEEGNQAQWDTRDFYHTMYPLPRTNFNIPNTIITKTLWSQKNIEQASIGTKDGTMQQISQETGKILKNFEQDENIGTCISQQEQEGDSNTIVMTTNRGYIQGYDIRSYKKTFIIKQDPWLGSLSASSPLSQYSFLTGTLNGCIQLYDIRYNLPVKRYWHNSSIRLQQGEQYNSMIYTPFNKNNIQQQQQQCLRCPTVVLSTTGVSELQVYDVITGNCKMKFSTVDQQRTKLQDTTYTTKKLHCNKLDIEEITCKNSKYNYKSPILPIYNDTNNIITSYIHCPEICTITASRDRVQRYWDHQNPKNSYHICSNTTVQNLYYKDRWEDDIYYIEENCVPDLNVSLLGKPIPFMDNLSYVGMLACPSQMLITVAGRDVKVWF